MTLQEAKTFIKQFWALPRVDKGQAQIPYLYDQVSLEKLNEATELVKREESNNETLPLHDDSSLHGLRKWSLITHLLEWSWVGDIVV